MPCERVADFSACILIVTSQIVATLPAASVLESPSHVATLWVCKNQLPFQKMPCSHRNVVAVCILGNTLTNASAVHVTMTHLLPQETMILTGSCYSSSHTPRRTYTPKPPTPDSSLFCKKYCTQVNHLHHYLLFHSKNSRFHANRASLASSAKKPSSFASKNAPNFATLGSPLFRGSPPPNFKFPLPQIVHSASPPLQTPLLTSFADQAFSLAYSWLL